MSEEAKKLYIAGSFAGGAPGEPGKDGYTPVKGVDYWTPTDKLEIISEVSNLIGPIDDTLSWSAIQNNPFYFEIGSSIMETPAPENMEAGNTSGVKAWSSVRNPFSEGMTVAVRDKNNLFKYYQVHTFKHDDVTYIGNLHLYSNSYEDNGLPFVVIADSYDGGSTLIVINSSVFENGLEILDVEYVSKIDPAYLEAAGSGSSGASSIPYFDLTDMGLPAVQPEDVRYYTTSVTNVDLTELLAAVEKGPVRIGTQLTIYSETTDEIAIPTVSYDSRYKLYQLMWSSLHGNGKYNFRVSFELNGTSITYDCKKDLEWIPNFSFTGNKRLPTIPNDGSEVSVGISDADMAELKAAMDLGPITAHFSVQLSDGSKSFSQVVSPRVNAVDNTYSITIPLDDNGSISFVEIVVTPATAHLSAKMVATSDGIPGAPGTPGADGYTPVKGVDYWTEADKAEIVEDVLEQIPKIDGTPGAPGADGKDGYTPVKGVDYWTANDKSEIVEDVLEQIPDVENGYTPVKGVDYWTEADKAEIVEDVIEQIPDIDGTPGIPGADGKDGYTPVKGVDYWTANDKSEIVEDVLEQIPDVENGYTPVKGVDYWTEADKAEIVEDVIEQIPIAAPFFNLNSLGLPTIPLDGSQVSVTGKDLSTMAAALDIGPVNVEFTFDRSSPIVVNAVINPSYASAIGAYQLLYHGEQDSNTFTILFIIDPNAGTIQASATVVPTIDDDTPAFFDLDSMGLPVIGSNGATVTKSGLDLSDMGIALENGHIALGVKVNIYGNILNVRGVPPIMYLGEEDAFQLNWFGEYNGEKYSFSISISTTHGVISARCEPVVKDIPYIDLTTMGLGTIGVGSDPVETTLTIENFDTLVNTVLTGNANLGVNVKIGNDPAVSVGIRANGTIYNDIDILQCVSIVDVGTMRIEVIINIAGDTRVVQAYAKRIPHYEDTITKEVNLVAIGLPSIPVANTFVTVENVDTNDICDKLFHDRVMLVYNIDDGSQDPLTSAGMANPTYIIAEDVFQNVIFYDLIGLGLIMVTINVHGTARKVEAKATLLNPSPASTT